MKLRYILNMVHLLPQVWNKIIADNQHNLGKLGRVKVHSHGGQWRGIEMCNVLFAVIYFGFRKRVAFLGTKMYIFYYIPHPKIPVIWLVKRAGIILTVLWAQSIGIQLSLCCVPRSKITLTHTLMFLRGNFVPFIRYIKQKFTAFYSGR